MGRGTVPWDSFTEASPLQDLLFSGYALMGKLSEVSLELQHDSGPRLVASLYHVGTFTRYSLPAFTGAFGPTPFTPFTKPRS